MFLKMFGLSISLICYSVLADTELYRPVNLTKELKNYTFNLRTDAIAGIDVLIPGHEGTDFFLGVDWKGRAWCKPISRKQIGDNSLLRFKALLDRNVGDSCTFLIHFSYTGDASIEFINE